MNRCIGFTKQGTRCRRRVKRVFCKQHLPENHWDELPEECIICCEPLLPENSVLSCGHYVHWACLDRWEHGYKCPICKRSLPEFSRRKPSLPNMSSPTLSDIFSEEDDSYITFTVSIPENDYDFVIHILETYYHWWGNSHSADVSIPPSDDVT